MTPNEMLTAVVQAMVGGGWKPLKGSPERRNPRLLSISEKSIVFIEYDYINYARKDRKIQQAYVTFTLPDLLADSSAMKAAFSSELLCIRCGGSQWSSKTMPTIQCHNCPSTDFIEAWQYHALEAMKLLHDPEKTSEDAIKYLYDNLPKGEKG